jgi:pyruvate dehydrogenase E2 component (dihydrolipoamide acetyltransferase)
MPTDVIMPKLGLTMESGTVERWLASTGETIQSGQPLLEVETDKVVVEVEAPAPGILGPLLVPEGESVPLGTVLARIYAPGEAVAEQPMVEPLHVVKPEPAQPAGQALPATPPGPWSAAAPSVRPDAVPGNPWEGYSKVRDLQVERPRGRIFSSPRARKRAREAHLDWRAIRGTGPGGRVIERDVLDAAAAERPYFHLSAEARADALLALQARLEPAIERKSGMLLTVTDLLIKIVATTLAETPRADLFLDPAGSRRVDPHRRVRLGVAVSTPAGLVIPSLRNPDRMGLWEIAGARSALVERAVQGMLTAEDLEGSPFALADLGMYRVDAFQAALRPPQVAILGVGRIAERPVALDGKLLACPTVALTLSCDHRAVDSILGAQVLDRIVDLIEEPYGLIAGREQSNDN